MNVKICLLIFLVVVNLSRIVHGKGGRGGGGGRSSVGRSSSHGWGSSSSSSSSSGKSSGGFWSFFGFGKSSKSSSSSSGSSSINKGISSQGTAHSHSNILPLSTGNRNTQNPSFSSGQSGAGNSRQPPGPGWNVNHGTGTLNNQPPQYPGMMNHPSHQGLPPSYSGHSSYNGAPPPYSGAPPPYPGTGSSFNYRQPPPSYPGISRAPNYPTQQGGPVYRPQQQYYPPSNHLPPPPPGYSPYGTPYYQKSSGISGSDVMMGLAFWQLSRSNNHHHHFHHYNDDSTYHGYNRNHYTTTYHSNSNSNAPGNQNILEMTHYVVPDEKGKITTIMGNQTCVSVYNAKAVNKWATKQMEDFKKKFPNTTFPLFSTGNETFKNNNFTMIPGRVVHIEPISITCCGTHKKPLELAKLTDGKSPNVNCVHLTGQIPFKKMDFIKIVHIDSSDQNMTEWFPLDLEEPDLNSTSAIPVNVTSTTPLTTDEQQTFSSLGINKTTITTVAPPFTTTTESIEISQTFSSLGINQTTTTSTVTSPTTKTTESIDVTQTYKPLGLNNSSTTRTETETGSVDASQTLSSVNNNNNTSTPKEEVEMF